MRRVAGRSPKIHIGKVIPDAMQLDSLHEEKVLPQRTGISTTTDIHWREVPDDCVSNAVIAKVNFFSFFEFVTEISRKRRTNFDDETLFEKFEIVGYCCFVQTGFPCKIVVIHF